MVKKGASKGVGRGIKVGKSFGKLGTVVKNTHLNISDVSTHGLNQSITRALPSSTIINTVREPLIVLQQNGGNYMYLTEQAVVVLNSNGRVVTSYPTSMFKRDILEVLNAVKK